MASFRRRSVRTLALLLALAGCGHESDPSGTERSSDEPLPVEESVWACMASRVNDDHFRLVLEVAMVPRADGRGEDFRSGIVAARLDRQVGAVEFVLDGDTDERVDFVTELAELDVVGDVYRTSSNEFSGCPRAKS